MLRTVLPEQSDPQAHRRALAFYRQQPQPPPFRLLFHAFHAGEHATLTGILEADPADLALLPGLWQQANDWPDTLRERLAVAVVRYRAVLGDYRHPEAQSALEYLQCSSHPQRRAWANVKQAEALIDAGRYDEAEQLVRDLPTLDGDARAEALLVQAALDRWHGDYERAEAAVARALEHPVVPLLASRAQLWRGLVAKDAGRFKEALVSLEQVQDNALLSGRARYQEGDLLMRLGRPAEGASRIEQALELLTAAAPEEHARVRARLGTVLRRLGRYDDAAKHLYDARQHAPDAFTYARITSEAAILEAARSHPWRALRLASEAEQVLRDSNQRPAERHYRYLRTLYRLGIAYWAWRSGQPYRQPFRGGAVVAETKSLEAKTLLERVLEEVTPLAHSADRYAALYVDACVTLALMSPPRKALTCSSQLLLCPTLTYLQNVTRLACAEATLRQDDAPAAAAQLATLRQLPPEPGLQAWKASLDAEMLLLLGQPEVACAAINEGLNLPAPFRAQLGWVWGQVLLERNYQELASRWLDTSDPLGLPEALAFRFEHQDFEQQDFEQQDFEHQDSEAK